MLINTIPYDPLDISSHIFCLRNQQKTLFENLYRKKQGLLQRLCFNTADIVSIGEVANLIKT
jgi:hypothetical protein